MAASIRSTSMPSRPNPISEQIEESLNQLRRWESSVTSTSSSSLCSAFTGLCGLYQSIHDLLQLPQTQKALADKRCVDEVLEGSVRLLDACETTRDVMLQIKDSLEDVQMALRRRGTEAELHKSIKTYFSLKKMTSIKEKTIKRSLIKALAKTDNCGFSSTDEIMAVVGEATSTSITIMESFLSYFSASSKPASSVKGWGVLKRIGNSERVACEEEAKKMNEMARLDASLSSLMYTLQKSKKLEEEQARDVQQLLKSFIGSIEGLDDGLNLLQRRLIQTRVSLLNILSQ